MSMRIIGLKQGLPKEKGDKLVGVPPVLQNWEMCLRNASDERDCRLGSSEGRARGSQNA